MNTKFDIGDKVVSPHLAARNGDIEPDVEAEVVKVVKDRSFPTTYTIWYPWREGKYISGHPAFTVTEDQIEHAGVERRDVTPAPAGTPNPHPNVEWA